jgi:hypothetical protein
MSGAETPIYGSSPEYKLDIKWNAIEGMPKKDFPTRVVALFLNDNVKDREWNMNYCTKIVRLLISVFGEDILAVAMDKALSGPEPIDNKAC